MDKWPEAMAARLLGERWTQWILLTLRIAMWTTLGDGWKGEKGDQQKEYDKTFEKDMADDQGDEERKTMDRVNAVTDNRATGQMS